MVYNHERNKGDESKMEEAAGKKRSYSIKIGSQMITIDIPEDAKEVDVDSDYTVAYCIGDIEVDYSSSFCESAEEALQNLQESYDIYADEPDNPYNIKPVQTRVGNYDAYFFRTVDSYPDEQDVACYLFLIEIERNCYLEVELDGDVDKLTEAKAFELADVKFRREPKRKSILERIMRRKTN